MTCVPWRLHRQVGQTSHPRSACQGHVMAGRPTCLSWEQKYPEGNRGVLDEGVRAGKSVAKVRLSSGHLRGFQRPPLGHLLPAAQTLRRKEGLPLPHSRCGDHLSLLRLTARTQASCAQCGLLSCENCSVALPCAPWSASCLSVGAQAFVHREQVRFASGGASGPAPASEIWVPAWAHPLFTWLSPPLSESAAKTS